MKRNWIVLLDCGFWACADGACTAHKPAARPMTWNKARSFVKVHGGKAVRL